MLAGSGLLYRRQRGIGIKVTRARAVSELTDRVEDRRRALVFLVGVLLEVAGMASGAFRLVCRPGPGRCLAVGLVTTKAGHFRTVIAGIIR